MVSLSASNRFGVSWNLSERSRQNVIEKPDQLDFNEVSGFYNMVSIRWP